MPGTKLSSSMEDYLEAIANLHQEKGVARVKDISRLLKVTYPSVTGAIANLERDELVKHEKYGYIELTPKGRKLAEAVLERHRTFMRFLTLVLRIDPGQAERDSCRMEHAIGAQTMSRLTKFIEFIETCPEEDTPLWLQNFHYYMQTGRRKKSCAGGEKKL
jgi:DtxR family Mn-dependent transcriptional regulator